MMSRLVLLLLAAVYCAESARSGLTTSSSRKETLPLRHDSNSKAKPEKKHRQIFSSPVNFFIQERASKQLPGPGQHFQFGALQSWETVLDTVQSSPDAKLLLLVRHGQALSNWLQDSLGPDEWFRAETKCTYDDGNGTVYNIFDAGEEQGRYLNTILDGGGWFNRMSGNMSVRAIVSPLTRCLQTSQLVSKNLPIKTVSVEENVRETLGEDTCDARRSVNDPDPDRPFSRGPCEFDQGLRSKYPMFDFPVVGHDASSGFGLLSDADMLWTKVREEQKDQVKRATSFLYDLWAFAPEKVIVVFTHSGFTRSILLAVGREPYRPQNTELVPAIVFKAPTRPRDDDNMGVHASVQ